MAYWPDVNTAIRAAKKLPSIGIDYARVAGDRYQSQRFQQARAEVIAVLRQVPKRERTIAEAYACTGMGYRKIARVARLSPSHVHRLHMAALAIIEPRLRALDLIPREEGLDSAWDDGTP